MDRDDLVWLTSGEDHTVFIFRDGTTSALGDDEDYAIGTTNRMAADSFEATASIVCGGDQPIADLRRDFETASQKVSHLGSELKRFIHSGQTEKRQKLRKCFQNG